MGRTATLLLTFELDWRGPRPTRLYVCAPAGVDADAVEHWWHGLVANQRAESGAPACRAPED
jgi:hypothetical protein